MDRLLVASEYTEPSAFSDRVIAELYEAGVDEKGRSGLLLITKKPSCCWELLAMAQNFNIPTVIHCTVTGFAGTVLEPNLSANWHSEIKAGRELMNYYDCVKDIVLRIDPLIPVYTTRVSLLSILREAEVWNYKRCRVSVIDYYPHVRNKFRKLGLYCSETFQPSEDDKMTLLAEVGTLAGQLGIQVESCAETIPTSNIRLVGCANREEWANYGLDLRSGRGQRKECFCNTPKTDLLLREPVCPVNCLYCYWGKNR